MSARIKDTDNFASRLSGLLERYGVSQSEIATQLDVSQAAVSGWVNGKIPVRRTAKQLARVLGVRLDWLLGAGDPSRPEASVAEQATKPGLSPPRSEASEAPLIVGLDAVALKQVAARLQEAATALSSCAKIIVKSAGKNRSAKTKRKK
jgi:transcriptional regulator with XRE-family HTH domain